MKQKKNACALILLLCPFLSFGQTPTINTPPQSQSVIAGSNASFSVVASGRGTPSLPDVSTGSLKLWLKADAGVVASGDLVSKWQDQSTAANHAMQLDPPKQPTLVNNAVPISGMPAVRFDGIQSASSGDFLHGTNDVGLSSAYTSFLVYSKTDQTIEEQVPIMIGIPFQPDSTREYYIRSGFSDTDNEMAFGGWANDYGTGFSIPADTFRIWTQRMNDTKSQLDFFDTDGVTSFTKTMSIGGLNTPSAGYYVGGLGDAVRDFQGDIAELIIYRGSLDESDRTAVENYLKLKYFQTSVPGGGSLTYQWKFNGTNIDQATSSTLTITNAQPENAGTYSVVVSNNFGGTETVGAVLTVNVPPSITVQPQSQAVLLGTNASFNVTATGTLPLSYQWFFKGIAIPDATDSTYTVSSAQFSDVGNYSVAVSNVAGLVHSDNAALRVPVSPSIFSQSGDQTVLAGTDVTLFVTAESVLPKVASGNLRLWLKADEGTVVENGRVVEWIDHSTNANHAVQANTDKQPLFINSVAEIGTRPTVRFDGIQNSISGDWMRGTNDVAITNGYTSFLLYSRANRNIPEQVVTGVGVPAQQSAFRVCFIRNDGEMAFSAWNEDYGTGYLIPPNTYRIWAERLNDDKDFLEFFDVTKTNSSAFTRNVGGLATPSAGYYLGGLGDYTRNFQGDISEFIVYQGALTEADRIAVQDYLKAKYYFGVGDNGISYQWQLNGTNIPGATNASFILSNAQPGDSGSYAVTLTNLAGSITSDPATVDVRYLFALGDGQRLTSDGNSFVASATISFQSYFANGMIFYTLDGSTPTFSSSSYSSPFALTHSATVRAIVYSSDFSKSGESLPVNVNVVPTYSLSATTAGGGNVVIDGTSPFLSNTVVSVTANADDGWTFLRWLDDATGTNATTEVTMTRNKTVRAVFGTSLNATAAGNGSVSIFPTNSLYPYGSIVRLTATPQPGSYFGIWGNAASGNGNPLYFTITNATPTVSSLFSTLSAGQFSLTLWASGSGRVSVSPRANAYNNGQLVTLTATPDTNQTFTGWSGDASGTANPLNVTMNQNKSITANFTKNPRLSAKVDPSTLAMEGLQLILSGEPGEIYTLQKSTNLTDWLEVGLVTNVYGTVQINDLPPTNSNEQFYRATQP
jgi:uncharacterized repeat protein (TIGR02543 family)